MMHHSDRRYTKTGSPDVERAIDEIVHDVASTIGRMVATHELCALILIGGYGRGEGGVELIDGTSRPHNNLDFLLITQNASRFRQRDYRATIDEALEPIRKATCLGIDFSIASADRIRRSPSRVMWYDMRFGHRTLLGDKQFAQSLERFTAESIPDSDVRNLLVNRGTLLVINDLILHAESTPTESTRRAMVRHIMKGIIGYGDALLHQLGRYDWSYSEKQERMRNSLDAPPEFRRLYDEAIEFRFQPDYSQHLSRNLGDWMQEVRKILEPIHLGWERWSLGRPELDWRGVVEAAFSAAVWPDPLSPRELAKKTVNLFVGPSTRRLRAGAAAWGARLAGRRGASPILFPIVAYELGSPELRQIAADCLGAPSNSIDQLRKSYLRRWGNHGDDNFNSFLRKHNVSLGEELEVLA